MPRIATDESPEKMINGSDSDHLEAHCFGELTHAIESKDVRAFRAAVEALVMNCFDQGDEPNAVAQGA